MANPDSNYIDLFNKNASAKIRSTALDYTLSGGRFGFMLGLAIVGTTLTLASTQSLLTGVDNISATEQAIAMGQLGFHMMALPTLVCAALASTFGAVAGYKNYKFDSKPHLSI